MLPLPLGIGTKLVLSAAVWVMLSISTLTMIIDRPIENTNWHQGVYESYDYEAKIYNKPSVHGINHGRISKIQIKKDNKVILNYDRGWDIWPESEDEQACQEIIRQLENTGEIEVDE